MTDEILEECIAFTARHLKPGGKFFAHVNVGEDAQTGGWRGFPVMRHTPEFWAGLAERHGLRCEDLGSRAELGDGGDEGALPPEQRRMFLFERV